MPPGPPKLLEDLAKVLIPPARREEVLGDLHERYKSPSQYLGDLFSTVPCVILSRIIRTTPIQLLLMDALLVYGSFLAAAWYLARGLVTQDGGLMRLAVPSGLALLYLLFSDAFTGPLRRSRSDWIRSIGIYTAFVALCVALGLATDANFYGFTASLMVTSIARLLFESGARDPQGVGGPALLAGRESRPISRTVRVTMTLILLAITSVIWWELVNK